MRKQMTVAIALLAALVVPAVAAAQPATDEYQIDIEQLAPEVHHKRECYLHKVEASPITGDITRTRFCPDWYYNGNVVLGVTQTTDRPRMAVRPHVTDFGEFLGVELDRVVKRTFEWRLNHRAALLTATYRYQVCGGLFPPFDWIPIGDCDPMFVYGACTVFNNGTKACTSQQSGAAPRRMH